MRDFITFKKVWKLLDLCLGVSDQFSCNHNIAPASVFGIYRMLLT